MQTRSGCRSSTQATALSAACAPREGTPRWKSERWAIRRPSSSDGNHVPLELELVLLEPRGDADELREMQDRHPEVLARRLLQLRLPRVEREVAERARGDDRVGAGLGGLLDRLDQLAERGLLARL